MSERQSPNFGPKRKHRGAAVAAVLCFAAAIAVVGTYTFRDYRESQSGLEPAQVQDDAEARAQTETQTDTQDERAREADTDLIINPRSEDPLLTDEDEAKESGDEADKPEKEEKEQKEPEKTAADSEETAGGAQNVSFSADSRLLWPVDGNVLMSFSMDKTVYFSTLDQFRYNPAMVISGEKGDQVISSAPGIVKSIDKTAQTGTTVNVDIGSGYELFYGQLADVAVKTGDYVDSKTVLGYVGDPTMYYSVEGCNVYFEMRKDGQPVDPREFLVE